MVLGVKVVKNAVAARAVPRTPLGELTTLPRLSSLIKRGGMGKGKERRDEKRGEGVRGAGKR